MTLFHFGNCVALVYVPYHLTYKYSGLSEYGAFWKCVQAGGIYIFVQLIKMLALATFFPTADSEGANLELLKSSMDIADLIGIYLVLNSIPGKGHAKVLTAGIGWASAEVVLTRFLLLWVGARGAEFDWKYIQKSLESNISLVQHITTATLVWLWSRHDLKQRFVPVVTSLLFITVYRPLIAEMLITSFMIGPWSALFIKAIHAAVLGSVTLHIYSALAHSIGIF
ncbi:unnamed protein product [Trichogramma brassicae]|uniref:BOS complex subunit TMEM147 n=1 Tax=Trichogramma brassicae TaxID=86971 RepID=A0A6H5IE45_9HYME|nr:unnamed protein product [Trichogramma brassicae]